MPFGLGVGVEAFMVWCDVKMYRLHVKYPSGISCSDLGLMRTFYSIA